MAINQYKFYGVNLATTDQTTILTPSAASAGAVETYIIKSLRVTNNTGNTPTITLTNNAFNIVKTQTLSANASVEILTLPLIIESNTSLKATMSSSDSVTIAISYLNIREEVTT
jgi:hypothetical protein